MLHPAFSALYVIAVLALTMAAFHPVFLCLSFGMGIVYSARVRGWSQLWPTLLWQLPMLLVIAVLNPIVSQAGSTILFSLGPWTVYAESLAYGLCMGMMLVAVLQWFSVAAALLPSDKVMILLGRVAPTIGLLLTMTMRLVPQFVRRGKHIADSQAACTAAGKPEGSLDARVRQVTVLMSWGMEDSLETSDAMRARGWGSTVKRTTYSRQRFGLFDGIACALLIALIALCVVCAVYACTQFAFYPAMQTLAPVWAYAPFAALLLVPIALEVSF